MLEIWHFENVWFNNGILSLRPIVGFAYFQEFLHIQGVASNFEIGLARHGKIEGVVLLNDATRRSEKWMTQDSSLGKSKM